MVDSLSTKKRFWGVLHYDCWKKFSTFDFAIALIMIKPTGLVCQS